jgi:cytochrome c oxidase assembly protein subunit 11
VLLLQLSEAYAGQEVRMPVVYYVDPTMLDDANTRNVPEITLSYTFNKAAN